MNIIPDDVVKAAQDTQKAYGIPASVTIAQWAVESGWGKTVSGKNNLGGVTAKVKGAVFPYIPGVPLEPATLCTTHEVVNGERIKCQRWFKDYPTKSAYFLDHSRILGTAGIYAKARAKLPDRNAFIDAFAPIYATSPGYAALLKSIIRTNKLDQYDHG